RDILKFFDDLPPERARVALRYWRADEEYLQAIAALDGATKMETPE
ncbi:MAG: hypothetical protein HY057_11470, partial [Rhodospirillales bacterium]|nr:hypothetical protein [Rhodospirillales bacterium]